MESSKIINFIESINPLDATNEIRELWFNKKMDVGIVGCTTKSDGVYIFDSLYLLWEKKDGSLGWDDVVRTIKADDSIIVKSVKNFGRLIQITHTTSMSLDEKPIKTLILRDKYDFYTNLLSHCFYATAVIIVGFALLSFFGLAIGLDLIEVSNRAIINIVDNILNSTFLIYLTSDQVFPYAIIAALVMIAGGGLYLYKSLKLSE
jgi:hypothetical protein